MTDDQRDRKIRFLVKRRFGDITRLEALDLERALERARKPPETDRSGTNASIEALANTLARVADRKRETEDEETVRLVAEYIASLERLDNAALDALYSQRELKWGLLQLFSDPEDTWTEQERFIEITFGTAEFAHWASLPHWHPDEAVALSLGVEPGFVPRQAFGYQSNPKSAHAFRRRRSAIGRAITAGTLPCPIKPASFVAWANNWNIELPSALVEAVLAVKAHQEVIDRASAPALPSAENDTSGQQLADFTSRERETYQKIVIGMAVSGYCYKPNATRSDAPKEIATDVHKLDLTVSDETVRNKLRDCAKLLSTDVRHELGD